MRRKPKQAYWIAQIPGDGIGKEVCASAVEVLKAEGSPLRFTTHSAGAEHYLACGDAFPGDTLQACRDADAILHGAAGLPGVNYSDGTEAGQDFSLKLRRALDLYANVRPIRLYDGVESSLRSTAPGIDYVIVRENSEGLYAARGGGNLIGDQIATDTIVMTRAGVERIARAAAGICLGRNGAPKDGVRRITIVDKANVLRTSAFFRKVATDVLLDYPDIEIEYALVDAVTAQLVQDPPHFDVIVCENFIGDIISDLGAGTVGGLGLAAAAEWGDDHGYFQASHGSAPDIAGKRIANPVATILSAAQMLQWLGHKYNDQRLLKGSGRINDACESVLRTGAVRTRDLGGGASTSDFTQAVVAAMQ